MLLNKTFRGAVFLAVMIKLRKPGKSQRFYIINRTGSVSPDFVGLQVSYGPLKTAGKTVFYWFRSRKTGAGKVVPAKVQLQRKVRYLVLRRLRNGYVFTRRCDSWCRIAVKKADESSRQPKLERTVNAKPIPDEPTWFSDQMSFDFNAEQEKATRPRVIRKREPKPRQLCFEFM